MRFQYTCELQSLSTVHRIMPPTTTFNKTISYLKDLYIDCKKNLDTKTVVLARDLKLDQPLDAIESYVYPTDFWALQSNLDEGVVDGKTDTEKEICPFCPDCGTRLCLRPSELLISTKKFCDGDPQCRYHKDIPAPKPRQSTLGFARRLAANGQRITENLNGCFDCKVLLATRCSCGATELKSAKNRSAQSQKYQSAECPDPGYSCPKGLNCPSRVVPVQPVAPRAAPKLCSSSGTPEQVLEMWLREQLSPEIDIIWVDREQRREEFEEEIVYPDSSVRKAHPTVVVKSKNLWIVKYGPESSAEDIAALRYKCMEFVAVKRVNVVWLVCVGPSEEHPQTQTVLSKEAWYHYHESSTYAKPAAMNKPCVVKRAVRGCDMW